jgi:hypothetical protein
MVCIAQQHTAACSVAIAFLKLFASRLMTGSPYIPARADIGMNAVAARTAAASFMMYGWVSSRLTLVDRVGELDVEGGGGYARNRPQNATSARHIPPKCHINHEQIQPAGLYPTFRNAVYISGGWHRQDRERVNSFGHQSYQKTRQNAFRQDSQELCLLRESRRRIEGMRILY